MLDEITIDRLFVAGWIYEAQRSSTKFDQVGKLPDTKKLVGIKSIEYQGEGFKCSSFRYLEDVSPKDQSQQQKLKKSKGSGTRR